MSEIFSNSKILADILNIEKHRDNFYFSVKELSNVPTLIIPSLYKTAFITIFYYPYSMYADNLRITLKIFINFKYKNWLFEPLQMVFILRLLMYRFSSISFHRTRNKWLLVFHFTFFFLSTSYRKFTNVIYAHETISRAFYFNFFYTLLSLNEYKKCKMKIVMELLVVGEINWMGTLNKIKDQDLCCFCFFFSCFTWWISMDIIIN